MNSFLEEYPTIWGHRDKYHPELVVHVIWSGDFYRWVQGEPYRRDGSISSHFQGWVRHHSSKFNCVTRKAVCGTEAPIVSSISYPVLGSKHGLRRYQGPMRLCQRCCLICSNMVHRYLWSQLRTKVMFDLVKKHLEEIEGISPGPIGIRKKKLGRYEFNVRVGEMQASQEVLLFDFLTWQYLGGCEEEAFMWVAHGLAEKLRKVTGSVLLWKKEQAVLEEVLFEESGY